MLDGPEDEASHRESWDAISLSLVVNFVPDAGDRGEWSLGRPNVNCEHNSHVKIQGRMLSIAYKMLKADGLLFLAVRAPHPEDLSC